MEELQKEQRKWIIGFNYFNIMDALLTLFILQNMGGRELNPFMAYLINLHPLAFFSFKIAFGLAATLILIKKKHFTSFKHLTIIFALVVLWNITMGVLKLLHTVL